MCSDFAAPSTSGFANPVPRVLVAEDDPASCLFLADGLRQLAVRVNTCGDGLRALECARIESFDMLLLDCHLPGASALTILAALRADPHAASHATVAVATSAEFEPGEQQALRAASFSSLLRKPCTLMQLHHLLASLPAPPLAAWILNNGAGLRSSGDYPTLRALRQLLQAELRDLEQQLEVLQYDRIGLDERLHRLRAACGFCGADALSAATEALQQEARQRVPGGVALAGFRNVLQATLHALPD